MRLSVTVDNWEICLPVSDPFVTEPISSKGTLLIVTNKKPSFWATLVGGYMKSCEPALVVSR